MRYWFALLIVFAICSCVHAQDGANDAAFEAALKKFDRVRDDTLKTAPILVEIAALRAGVPTREGPYLRRMTYDAFVKDQVAVGTEYAEQGIAVFKKQDDWFGVTKILHILGYEALQRKEYAEVIRYAQMEQEAAHKAGEYGWEGGAYEKMGLANVNTSNNKKAVEYYRRGIALAKSAEDWQQVASIYGNLTYIFRQTSYKNEDSLMFYLTESLEMTKSLPRPDSANLGYLNMSLAMVSAKKEDLTRAIGYMKRAFDYHNDRTPPNRLVDQNRYLARLYVRNNQFDLARQHFYKGLSVLKHHSDIDGTWLYFGLMNYHETSDNLDSVVHYAKAYTEAAVKSQIEKRNTTVANLEAQYETREKQAEIDRLALEDKLNQAQLTRQRWIIGGALIALGLLGSFLYFIYQQRQRIQAQNETISVALKEKDTLLKEIHHRVKNNLQMVSSLLSLQSDFIEDDKALDALQMGQRRVRSMAIIHQKLYLRDEVKTAVSAKDYLDQLISELLQTLNINGVPLTMTKRLENIDLDIDRLIPLGLIANEVITNAMKYAFTNRESGKLAIDFRRAGKDIELIIADDGPGLSEELATDSDSFGSLLIQTFAEQLEGEINIDGDNGTTVSLRFPE